MTETKRYTLIAIILHWIVALCVIGLLGVGFIMVWAPVSLVDLTLKFDLYQWHKSFGVSVFSLMTARIAWRLPHRPPALPDTISLRDQRLAGFTHVTLYILLLSMPLIGWVVVSTASFNVPTFLFQTFHLPHIGFFANHADKAFYNWLSSWLHLAFGIAISALIVLHIAGVLKHQLFEKLDIISRILPFKDK